MNFRVFYRSLFIVFLGVSSLAHAQVEVVEQDEIDRYMLDFSENDPNPYRLVVGPTNGALYLRDNSDGTHQKISQCLNGVPAAVANRSGTFYQADDDFENIVYVSDESCISQGDNGTNEDVFVYNRTSGKTLRVPGNQPHEGDIYNVRINSEGDMVAFGSRDGGFGDTSNIILPSGVTDISETEAVITYFYRITDFDANQGDLFTPSHELEYESGLGGLGGLGIFQCGQACQFTNHNSIILYWPRYLNTYYYFEYDIDTDNLEEISRSSLEYPGYAAHGLLSNRRHLVSYYTDYDIYTDMRSESVAIRDTLTNERVSLVDDKADFLQNGYRFGTAYLHDAAASGFFRTPLNLSRYVAYYSFTERYGNGSVGGSRANVLPYNTGTIFVHDIATGETKKAFNVERKARSYGGGQGGSDYPEKYTCINCDGFEDYDLDPSDVRFHNNNQYITFEANNWYLDPSIAYNDFVIPYTRDLFVVANPFTSGVNVDGAPSIDASTDQGWFIWRDNGVWHSRFVAGGTNHRFIGSLESTEPMNNLQPISIETSDVLELNPSTMLNFNLVVTGPYRDGFTIGISDSASTCVGLTSPSNLNIYLGPDRVVMPASFDLTTQADCVDSPDIETLGKPTIDRSADNGIFLWENSDHHWQAEVVSGDGVRTVELDVNSQQQLSDIQQINIESSDVFTILPMSLDLSLRVRSPWYDGFRFTEQSSSNTCVSTTNNDMPIFLGPNRINVGNGVNLDTQASCP